jgi:uroporphyrinogen decarboxylase
VNGSSAFVDACLGKPVTHTPVWFMRQAGRSLPEYRRVREGVGMLEACLRTDLIVEITTQPVRRHGVDAAILFSDIVLPLRALGVDLDIVAGVGPVIAEPVRSLDDVRRLPAWDPASVVAVTDAVEELAGSLPVPLIGFAGAPFTVASYLVEGGPSRDHARTKALMHADEDAWHELMRRLADISGGFLRAQVDAGAAAVQLFDSWAGALSPSDYRRFVLPHTIAALQSVDVPRIHFGVGTGELLADMAADQVDVLGVDFRVPLSAAAARLPRAMPLQGNLDPAFLFAPWPVLRAAVDDVLVEARDLPGHIFNLGHGVLPDTDPDQLTRVVEYVHATTRR